MEKVPENNYVSGTREFKTLGSKTNWTTGCDCVKRISSPRIEGFCVKLPILTLIRRRPCILLFSHGTSSKFADVRTHLRKVSNLFELLFLISAQSYDSSERWSKDDQVGDEKASHRHWGSTTDLATIDLKHLRRRHQDHMGRQRPVDKGK